VEGVNFVIFNTDGQGLRHTKADMKIQIGEKTTHGRGTGRDPEKGKFAANEDKEKIAEVLKGTNIIFLTAGLGGGTGTGSSPVIAKIARDLGSIVIAMVTTPFNFEGINKLEQARTGLEILEKNVDTLIHIPNERLGELINNSTPMLDAFAKVDEIISRTVASIADLINKPKVLLDIDFADICSIVENAGRGIVGLGCGTKESRMEKAAHSAVDDPLLEKSEIMEARKILISITGSPDLALKEVSDAMDIIQTRISSGSRELGVTIDSRLQDEVKITLLATGIGKSRIEVKKPVVATKPETELPLEGTASDIPANIDIPPSLRHRAKTGAKPEDR
jgi:cell division protein FtsZ